MQPLSQEFIDQCPVDHGYRQRGLEMTRIEVFVGGVLPARRSRQKTSSFADG
jgi:hypothetical protein